VLHGIVRFLFNKLEDEIYKWELVNEYKGRPNTDAPDFFEEINSILKEKLENWSLDRLPKIERTILRLAVYELRFSKEVPERVVLNEAIELCKMFGDEKSGRFVNGVLSKFAE